MNPYLSFGLNALAVLLTGAVTTLTTFQVAHAWEPSLVAGGVVTGIDGLAQLAKYGVVVNALMSKTSK